MKSIVSKDLEPKKEKTSKRILKTSLALVLIVFAFTMSPYSFFQILKPAMAAGLSSVSVVPASNIINERARYDIFLKIATSGTIKTIQMDFPSSFNLAAATKYIERSGIGSGSLSVTGTTLKYTVSSPISVPAGTTIRLEIARIVATAAGSFTVSIKTLNTGGGTIDGPTTSGSFTIKSITGSDVSKGFMIRKDLLDDAAGNAHGWNPTGATQGFTITDDDVSQGDFVSVAVQNINRNCVVDEISDTQGANTFDVLCSIAPQDSATLHYLITKLPVNVVTSSLSVSSSESTPSSLSSSESAPSSQSSSIHSSPRTFASSQDTRSIDTQDETALEFP